MWVESVTMGSPQHANILSRFGSTAMRSKQPDVREARNDSCDIDESACKFKKIHSDRLFLEGTIRKEGTAKKCSGLLPLDSAPPGFSTGGNAAI
jgi:hypothetical protein